MEQKQIDDLEESYHGEEFIDEEDFEDVLGTVKSKPKRGRQKKAVEAKVTKTIKTADKTMDAPNHKESYHKEKDPLAKAEKEYQEKVEKTGIKITPLKEELKISSAKDYSSKDSAKEKTAESVKPAYNPWEEDEEKDPSKASTWKVIAGLLVIALIFSILTQGFDFSEEGKGASTEISLSAAEEKTKNYVNSNLLQPPFVAEVKTSEDVGSLYKITLSVAGQDIDSYITKDGQYFFPQGFDTSLTLAATDGINTTADGAANTVRLEVSADDDAVKGNRSAPVTIVEFSDYECPFCGKYARESYPLILKNYINKGQVKYVFRDFPLEIHVNAQKAAEAAECAGEQNKYYEMHDYLFANQDNLKVENLQGYAKDLGLDTVKFNDCLGSGKMAAEVKKDLADGKRYGVAGTPAFFVNGRAISGAQPYSVFSQEIEAALAEAVPAGTETAPAGTAAPAEAAPAEETPPAAPVAQVQEFTINAKRWLFSPNELTVNLNDKVKLTIVPSDLQFTFSIPEFKVEEQIAGQTTVEFIADKAGSFEFKCSSCEDFRGMTGTLVVK